MKSERFRSRRPKSNAPLVLIAENHDEGRAMWADYFDANGFRVLTACDGLTAYEAAISAQPDVVVMDLLLPQLDGWEATRRLKRNPATAHIPVIACTGDIFFDAAVERALVAGCDGCFIKPCPPDVVLREVRQLLHRFAEKRSA